MHRDALNTATKSVREFGCSNVLEVLELPNARTIELPNALGSKRPT
jgi:hypothetical protein